MFLYINKISKIVHKFYKEVDDFGVVFYIQSKSKNFGPPNLSTSLIIRLYFDHKSMFKRILILFFLINFNILKNTIQEIYNTNSKIVHFFAHCLNISLFYFYCEYGHYLQYISFKTIIMYNML